MSMNLKERPAWLQLLEWNLEGWSFTVLRQQWLQKNPGLDPLAAVVVLERQEHIYRTRVDPLGKIALALAVVGFLGIVFSTALPPTFAKATAEHIMIGSLALFGLSAICMALEFWYKAHGGAPFSLAVRNATGRTNRFLGDVAALGLALDLDLETLATCKDLAAFGDAAKRRLIKTAKVVLTEKTVGTVQAVIDASADFNEVYRICDRFRLAKEGGYQAYYDIANDEMARNQ